MNDAGADCYYIFNRSTDLHADGISSSVQTECGSRKGGLNGLGHGRVAGSYYYCRRTSAGGFPGKTWSGEHGNARRKAGGKHLGNHFEGKLKCLVFNSFSGTYKESLGM